jgi:hypothetical protein
MGTTATLETVEGRSAAIGNAVQNIVAADPGLALSLFGAGLDALSSMLIHKPDEFVNLGGWVRLIAGAYEFVVTGESSAAVDDLLAGRLPSA